MAQVALLHFNGSDESTTFNDEVGVHSWSAVGNAKIKTDQSVFGGASYRGDGTGDYIRATTIDDLGTGFSFDFRFRISTALPSGGTSKVFAEFGASLQRGISIGLNHNIGAGNVKLILYASSNGTSADIANAIRGTSTTWAIDTWYHIAVCHDSVNGKYFVYKDGALDITITSASSIFTSSGCEMRIGANLSGTESVNGWIDEFLLTDDIRFPNGDSFTPPSEEYASPITGDADVTLPVLTLSADGFGDVFGDASNTLPLFTLDGVLENVGPNFGDGGNLTLPLFRMSASEDVQVRLVDFSTGVVGTRPQFMNSTPAFTRATAATFEDWEQVVRPVLSGEARFHNCRRVHNLRQFSQAFDNAYWTKVVGTITSDVVEAPDGTITADRLNGAGSYMGRYESLISGHTYVLTVYARSITQSSNVAYGALKAGDNSNFVTTQAVDQNAWTRLHIKWVENGLTIATYFQNISGDADIYWWGAQLEDVTGQSNENPGEYVSTNVLSTPYHGAHVDGVKYFAHENFNVVSGNSVVTTVAKAAILPGEGSSYFSTPDSAANSITGDIDIRMNAAPASWRPASLQTFASKWGPTNERSWLFRLTESGIIQLSWTPDGTSASTVSRSATTTIDADPGEVKWIRATLDVDNGASGHDVKFYTSEDGVVWDQLGATVTTAGTTSIFDNAHPIEIGTLLGAISPQQPLNGKVYYAEIRNGIDGTVASRFNPSDYSGIDYEWFSTTGEIWSIKGNARVESPLFRKVAHLPGAVGSYFSTPDSVANSVTGDIDLRARIAADNWTPTPSQRIISKRSSASTVSFDWLLESTGVLTFAWSPDGSTVPVVSSTVAVGSVNRTTKWVRVTLDVDNGASGHDVKFYTSEDGVVWDQLGATVTTAGTTSIFDSSSDIWIGELEQVSRPFSGKIYYAEVRNGIDGPVVSTFDPHNYSGVGSGWILANGETWTINGLARIYDTLDLTGYFSEPGRTNLLPKSSEHDHASWAKSGISVTANATTAPDGTSSADKWEEDSAISSVHNISATVAAANGTYTFSIFLKAAERSKVALIIYDGATGFVGSSVDLLAGTIVTEGTGGVAGSWTNPSREIVAYPNGWYRVTITGTSGAGTTIQCALSLSLSGTIFNQEYTGTVGFGVYAWGAQLELSKYMTSHIPTDTVSVVRNSDVLTYPSVGNIDYGAPHSVYAEGSYFGNPGSGLWGVLLGSDSNYNGMLRLTEGNPNPPTEYFSDTGGSGGASIAGLDINKQRKMGKYAGARDSSDVLDVFAAGIKGTSFSPVGSGGGTQIQIGCQVGTSQLGGPVRNVRLFQTRLTDTQLLELTGPDGDAELDAPLKLLDSLGAPENFYNASLLAPLKTLLGQGYLVGSTGTFDMTLPLYSFEGVALTGIAGNFNGSLPMFLLEAGGNHFADLTLPLFTLESLGLTGGVGVAGLTLPPLDLLAAAEGLIIAQANNVLPLIENFGTGVHGTVGNADLHLRMLRLIAAGTIHIDGSAALTLPLFATTGIGYPEFLASGSNSLPLFQMVGTGYHPKVGVYRIWALNMRKGALTEYAQFNFNSFAKFNGVLLGADASGIRIIGQQDKDGAANIDALIRTGNHGFDTSYNKRVPRLYVGYRADGSMVFQTITTHDGPRTYRLPPNGNEAHQQRRVPVGRGPKSTYWQFGAANEDGADFDLNSIIAYPEVTKRRVF